MENQEQKNKLVFLVDDDSFLLDMYAIRFTKGGYTVKSAMNANEALQKLRGGLLPDVCVFDVVMPSIDGFELLEIINKEGLTKNSLKIILSNLAQEQDFERAKSLGAVGYIVKANNTPSEVVEKVTNILKEHGI